MALVIDHGKLNLRAILHEGVTRIVNGVADSENGAIVCGVMDISSNVAAGVTILAEDLGLEVIDGIVFGAAQFEDRNFSYTRGANGVSVTVTTRQQSTEAAAAADIANDADAGLISYIAWGRRVGATQNLPPA